MRSRLGRGRGARLQALLLTAVALLLPAKGRADEKLAWVNGEVRLNVRRGAGNEFEIIGGVSSNDPVTVIAEQGDWTQVRLADGHEGWIPEGYLTTEPPAQIRLADLETEAGLLREDLGKTTAQAERLTRENRSLNEQVTSLTEETSRASRRVWFVGVIVLVFGVLLGAILRGDPRRRRSSRLRF